MLEIENQIICDPYQWVLKIIKTKFYSSVAGNIKDVYSEYSWSKNAS